MRSPATVVSPIERSDGGAAALVGDWRWSTGGAQCLRCSKSEIMSNGIQKLAA